jgi:hypothetical protein
MNQALQIKALRLAIMLLAWADMWNGRSAVSAASG